MSETVLTEENSAARLQFDRQRRKDEHRGQDQQGKGAPPDIEHSLGQHLPRSQWGLLGLDCKKTPDTAHREMEILFDTGRGYNPDGARDGLEHQDEVVKLPLGQPAGGDTDIAVRGFARGLKNVRLCRGELCVPCTPGSPMPQTHDGGLPDTGLLERGQ